MGHDTGDEQGRDATGGQMQGRLPPTLTSDGAPMPITTPAIPPTVPQTLAPPPFDAYAGTG
jgi:hypothetical protein